MIIRVDEKDYEVNDTNLIFHSDLFGVKGQSKVRNTRKIYQVSEDEYLDIYEDYQRENKKWYSRMCFQHLRDYKSYKDVREKNISLSDASDITVDTLYDRELGIDIRKGKRKGKDIIEKILSEDETRPSKPVEPVKSNVTKMSDYALRRYAIEPNEILGEPNVIQLSDYKIK